MGLAADILDHISTAVIALDGELTVLAANTSAEALLQISESRVVDTHASALSANSRDWLESLAQVRDRNSPLTRRGMSLRLTTGQEIQVDLMITPIH